MASTVITNAGLQAAAAASGGPQIKILKARFGSSVITPTANMTDVSNFVYEAPAEAIRYRVTSDNTVIFRVTLDENVGNFNIGNIGLVLEGGVVFSISGLTGVVAKNTGNRISFTIPIVLAGMATITNLTVLSAEELSIPEVATQAALPDANSAPFNLYLVRQNTLYSNKATLASPVSGTWRYYVEDTGAGALTETNGVVVTGEWNAGVTSGTAVYYDDTADEYQAANITDKPPIGIRGTGDTLHMGGSVYTHGSAVYSAGKKYYVQADGTLSQTVTDFLAGYAVSTTKLIVLLGMVTGKPWTSEGVYTAGGRVKTAFLTGVGFWPSAVAGRGALAGMLMPASVDNPSLPYWQFPKVADGQKKIIEILIPIVKSMNRAVPATLILWWMRPTSGSSSGAVRWAARHARFTDNVTIAASFVSAVEVTDTAGSAGASYKSDAISLDFSTYSAEDIGTLQIYRDVADAADLCTSDAYLIAAFLKYTEATDTDA